MPKGNLKLISVRIDPETLAKIEEYRKDRRYWKRNTIINAVLTAVFADLDEADIYDMVRRPFRGYSNLDAKYREVR